MYIWLEQYHLVFWENMNSLSEEIKVSITLCKEHKVIQCNVSYLWEVIVKPQVMTLPRKFLGKGDRIMYRNVRNHFWKDVTFYITPSIKQRASRVFWFISGFTFCMHSIQMVLNLIFPSSFLGILSDDEILFGFTFGFVQTYMSDDFQSVNIHFNVFSENSICPFCSHICCFFSSSF